MLHSSAANATAETRYLVLLYSEHCSQGSSSISSNAPHRHPAFFPLPHLGSHLFTHPLSCSRLGSPPLLYYSQEFATAQARSCPYKEVGAVAWTLASHSHPSPPETFQEVKLSHILSKLSSPHVNKISSHCSLQYSQSKLKEGAVIRGEAKSRTQA